MQNSMLVTTRRCADIEIRPKSITSTRGSRSFVRSFRSRVCSSDCLFVSEGRRADGCAAACAALFAYSRVLLEYCTAVHGYSLSTHGYPCSGVRYFFSSFFFRDEAYKQLVSFWQQARSSRGKGRNGYGNRNKGTENRNKGTEHWNKGTEIGSKRAQPETRSPKRGTGLEGGRLTPKSGAHGALGVYSIYSIQFSHI